MKGSVLHVFGLLVAMAWIYFFCFTCGTEPHLPRHKYSLLWCA
ncbi:hypothetical protein ACMBCN_02690 [Candidatus Liberibacter asiaticus]